MPDDARTPDDLEPRAALLRALVDKLPAMVAYWDASLRCRFANRAYERWFGVKPEAMIGRDMAEFLGALYPLNRPFIEGALRGEAQEFEREIPDPAGGPARFGQASYIPDIVGGTVRGFCVLVADITRRVHAEQAVRDMERQLQSAERRSAMATLAAGIAHEINNPLAAVLSNVELSLEAVDAAGGCDRAAVKAALADARDATKRIRDIVESMKLLDRTEGGTRERVDVNRTLERSVALAAAAGRYHARLVRELRHVGHVEGNASQLAQVFVSLLINAAQALPDAATERNEIRVATRRDGDQIVIEVRDNGAGIPDDLKSRIFDPFFTTKGVGGGVGLGLARSSSIVSAMGGSLTVTSAPAEGTCARVVLPAAAREEPSAAAAASRLSPLPDRPGARAQPRVLVVDDEPALGKALKAVLGDDFEVDVVTHGREALALLAEGSPHRYDLILCDLMMPELSGEDVYVACTKARPELARRFVFMTGGAFTPRGRKFLDSVGTPILEKPFDIKGVRALVSERLARERPR